MVRILVTNDDGIHSKGLEVLARSVEEIGETWVVAPERPKSATGLGMTLHKPLRVKNVKGRERWFSISGTPSDIIHLAKEVIVRDIDLVVSGVNVGDNTSIQVILSSGTIGAAAQAALLGIPAIAFSMAVSDDDEILAQFDMIAPVIRAVAEFVLERRMPPGVDIISVNFPEKIDRNTRIKIAPAAKLRYREVVDEREDPMGRKYYWIYGEPTNIVPGTDVHVVFREKNIAITPLRLDINVPLAGEGMWERRNMLNELAAQAEKALEK